MPTRILPTSDLHFGSAFVPAVAEALLETIPSLAPDAIVMSGNLPQRAKREQSERTSAFFKLLPDVPLLIIPGNHDTALWRFFERLFKPYVQCCEIISAHLNPVVQVGIVAMAGLDSTAARHSSQSFLAFNH